MLKSIEADIPQVAPYTKISLSPQWRIKQGPDICTDFEILEHIKKYSPQPDYISNLFNHK